MKKLNLKRIPVIFVAFLMFSLSFPVSGCNKQSQTTYNSNTYDSQNDLYINSKINKVNQIAEENEIAKSFYFITDLHWEKNSKKSPELVEVIRAGTGIDGIVFCGDYIGRGYDKKADALSMMQSCISSFGTDEYVAILGNHDNNKIDNPAAEEASGNETIKLLNNGKFDETYFSINDEENKIGCIYLNTNCFTKNSLQYEWLEQKIQSYQSDWTVLIFMHEYNEWARAGICIQKGAKGILIDKLLLDNKDTIKCSLAGIFSAHTHRDYFDFNSIGCPIISTTCDSIGVYAGCDNLYTREKDTITEQAFDVVQMDIKQRKVFLTRIGAGVDRTYYY